MKKLLVVLGALCALTLCSCDLNLFNKNKSSVTDSNYDLQITSKEKTDSGDIVVKYTITNKSGVEWSSVTTTFLAYSDVSTGATGTTTAASTVTLSDTLSNVTPNVLYEGTATNSNNKTFKLADVKLKSCDYTQK